MTQRHIDIDTFLSAHGWGKAVRYPIPGDASSRRYERLELGEKKAVLMDAPMDQEGMIASADASIKMRTELGYTALARLAGGHPESFAAISHALTIRGFSAPDILAANMDQGLMILEDLGADLFARVLEKDPTKEDELYASAIDTLAAIYRSSFSDVLKFQGHEWQVHAYDEAALQAEADLFLDWFAPDFGYPISDVARQEWYDIWASLFPYLKTVAPGLALRDFHAENLFWLPGRDGPARVGLIDFQDALFVHPAYDLVSLLEDARRDVRLELRKNMKARFCQKAGIPQDDNFETSYAVLAAQRNAKILGFPVRADIKFGKPQYRALLPRVAKLFWHDLTHPKLWPLLGWVNKNVPGLGDMAAHVKTAMVLAAGHGTRMQPLTNDRSKAMVEVSGRPLIDYTLERLSQAGIDRAVVNVHAHADHLEAHLKAYERDLEIVISDERARLLETGGGVVKALPLLGHEPIFICNIDAIWTEKRGSVLGAMLKEWDPSIMDDLLLLAPKVQTLGYKGNGDFNCDPQGRLIRAGSSGADYVYAGVQLARLDPIKLFPEEPFSRNRVWDQSLKRGRLFGYVLEGFWMHVGDPDAREAAEMRISTYGYA